MKVIKVIGMIVGGCCLCLLPACINVQTVAGSGDAGCGDGASVSADFKDPSGITVDPWGSIFVADAGCNKIRRIAAGDFFVTTYAGTGAPGCTDGDALNTAKFNYPVDIDRDTAGNYYVADRNNHVIRKITQAGTVETIAGTCGTPLVAPEECVPNEAPCSVKSIVPETVAVSDVLFNNPSGVAVDKSGNIYIADYGTCSVRKIDVRNGVVTTIGKKNGVRMSANVGCCGCAGSFRYPTGIDIDSAGNIIVAEYWGHKISKIDAATEEITVIAGNSFGFRDGPGDQASFMHPYHLSVDTATDTIYVVDLGNNRIRKIANDDSHTVSTLAGNGVLGYRDGKATDAEFNHPRGIEFIEYLLVYVGDTGNHRIREIYRIPPCRSVFMKRTFLTMEKESGGE
jgi:sugar lactone lactonase YvrE